LSAFEQTALRVFVDLLDNAGSSLRPQACPFVRSLLIYLFLSGGGLRMELRHLEQENDSNDQ